MIRTPHVVVALVVAMLSITAIPTVSAGHIYYCEKQPVYIEPDYNNPANTTITIDASQEVQCVEETVAEQETWAWDCVYNCYNRVVDGGEALIIFVYTCATTGVGDCPLQIAERCIQGFLDYNELCYFEDVDLPGGG